jgi:transposase-like protein
MARPEGGPEYSEETRRRIAALAGQTGGGIHKVAVLHEQFCADALRRGATKCLCHPEIKVVTAGETEERFQRAYANHCLTRQERG